MQINHIKSPDQTEFFSREKKHMCSSPIQELYLVLSGTLNLDVADSSLTVKSKELLFIPSQVMHQITGFSEDVEFLVIRYPPSDEKTKNY
jgi:mannose-6-phosphate isomerase-like protein (cupin superfamily)